MPEIQLQVVIDSEIEGIVPDAISYETGLTREEAADPNLFAYEHHGQEFSAVDPGALTRLYEDMALGRPMPLKFVAKEIKGIDTLFAIALFYHRDLTTHPQMPGLIANVDLTHRLGIPMYGHIDQDLTKFFKMLGCLFPSNQTKGEMSQAIETGLAWIYEYVTNGVLPHLGHSASEPQILEVGSNGFVLAQGGKDLYSDWVELYRQGFLRGVLVGQEVGGYRPVLASRKSLYVPFNLTKAAEFLNGVEAAMGEPAEWKATELWLHSPSDGTQILVQDLLEVFLRI